MTHASLFSGIGGFDLAAEWAGFENIFTVEIDEFCNKVLEKNFPAVKKYKDIYEFNGTKYTGQIDIISGGFPCQPVSQAGKRKGTADDRWLWPEMLRIISEIKPTWIIVENVYGMLNIENGLVFKQVHADLEAEGYETQTFIIPASAKNAPHRRNRVWIIAHTNEERLQGKFGTNGKERQEIRDKQFARRNRAWENDWVEVATTLCGVDDGVPGRVDRLKALGNAIVPQVAYEIFKSISTIEKDHK